METNDYTYTQLSSDHSYADTQRTNFQTTAKTLTTVIITSGQVNIAKVHPIKLKNELHHILGNIHAIKVFNNSIILKLDEDQTATMKKTKKLLNYNITVKIQRSTQGTKGVIHGVSNEIEMDELQFALTDYHVISATRFGKLQNSETVLLTFNTTSLPPFVTIGLKQHRVKTYIPQPVRCYNCNRYGHTSTYCTTKIKCPNCAGNHKYTECNSTNKKCQNCGGNHNAAYKGCSEHQKAKEITEYKT